MNYIFILFFIFFIIYILQQSNMLSNLNIEYFKAKKKSKSKKSKSKKSKSKKSKPKPPAPAPVSEATSAPTSEQPTSAPTSEPTQQLSKERLSADELAMQEASKQQFSSQQLPTEKPVQKIDIDLPKLSTDIVLDNYTKTNPSTEQIARSTIGTVRSQVEYSKIYPIGINFDAQFSNYNNLLSNTSISLLNEILTNTKFKANEKSSIINFNPNLKAVQSLLVTENDVLDYGNYIVSLMNGVSVFANAFSLKKVIPIIKEQFDNQIRLNFHIEILYKYPKSKKDQVEMVPKDFTILLNAVMLFEKIATNSNPTIEYFKAKKKSSSKKSSSKKSSSKKSSSKKSSSKKSSSKKSSSKKSSSKKTTSKTTSKTEPVTSDQETSEQETSAPSNVKIYLETLVLLGIGNYGFLPGYQK